MADVVVGVENFDSTKTCSVCGIIENLKRCGKCLSTWYCGREHQVQDWKNHKKLCKELQQKAAVPDGTKLSTTTTPSPIPTTQKTGVRFKSRTTRSRPVGKRDPHTDTGSGQYDEAGASLPLNVARQTETSVSVERSEEHEQKQKNRRKNEAESKKNGHDHEPSKVETLNNQVQLQHGDGASTSDTVGDKTDSEKQDNRASQVKRKQSEANYDSRPFRRCKFPSPENRSLNALTQHIAKQLRLTNRCIVDDLLPVNAAQAIRIEVEKLHASGSFVDGPLSGGKASSDNSKKYSKKAIRSDKITWLQGNEIEYPNICKYMKHLDCIVQTLNGHLEEEYTISGRTKVCMIYFKK